jgi:hypothetical protein
MVVGINFYYTLSILITKVEYLLKKIGAKRRWGLSLSFFSGDEKHKLI